MRAWRRGTASMAGITIARCPETAKVAVDALVRIRDQHPDRYFACDTEVVDMDVKKQTPVGHGKVIAASIYAGDTADFGNGPRLFIDNLDDAAGTLDLFKPFFEDPKSPKVWHNYSFDRHVLYNHGIDCTGFGGDTMHMARLWDSSRPMKGGYSLESLSRDVLLDRKRPIKELFGKKILKDGSEAKLNVMPDLSELQRDPKTRPAWIDYSTNDAVATWLLHQRLSEFLRNKSCVHCNTLLDFYNAKWRDFGELLTDIERAGVYLRTDYLSRIEAQATADAESHWSGFREWVAKQCPDGKFMNVKSRTQVQQLLFAPATLRSGKALGPERIFKMENLDNYIEPGKDKALKQRPFVISGLGIEPVSFTANGMPSVDSAALELLAGDPLADPPRYGSAYKSLGGNEAGREACLALDGVVKATAIEKLLNTYICPLQLQIDAQSRIHCSLNLNTGTGRLSARRPNLQNQPSLEKDVYKVRDAFAAAPGMKLVVADYGQLELRVLAHMSKCQSMIEAFGAGGDFHSRTAMSMYDNIREAVNAGEVMLEWDYSKGSSPKPLLKERFAAERRQAKTLNFSIAYGKTVSGLAKDWGTSRQEAQATLKRWYDDRPEVLLWQETMIKSAHKTGEVQTLMGRYRRLLNINSSSRKERSAAERAAINTPIQGGAADIVMAGMIRIWKNERLKKLGWKLTLQIHDEVVLEGPEDSAPEALKIVRTCMERPFADPLLVDLIVDATIVDTWYQAK